ncbi:29327_t:CDS:2, partial [Racocetra persica]
NFNGENVTDFFNTQLDQNNFDNKNEIDYSNTQYSDAQLNELESHNDNINIADTSSHMEIIENSHTSDDYNNSDNSNQSDQNNNSEQDGYNIYEEIDSSEETDNEDHERITPSSLLNVNSRLPEILDILPEPSYNPPQMIYPYQSIITRMASILADETNERLMDSPFKRQVEKGDKTDVRIGLALNLDWYTPYSRVKRSCAPIYITVLNFPRHIRYRSENLILTGIIPGPREPDTTQLQNYLQPIINELKQLWSGQLFKTTLYPIGRMFHCALIQIACNIPAVCKDSPKLGIKQLYEIQDQIDATPLPVDIGHINFKITSGFDALTADQWKTWSQRIITEAEIEAGHIAMMTFLKYAEQIYGKRFCSPNMHLHKHLREELGLFPNSNRNMELEVLENFNHQIHIQQIKTTAFSYLPQNFLSSLDLIAQTNIEQNRTLGHYNFTVQEALNFRAMSGGLINHVVTGSERFPGHFIGPFREIILPTKITEFLVQYYSNIYPNYSFHSENQNPNSKQSILVSSTSRRAIALKLEMKYINHSFHALI